MPDAAEHYSHASHNLEFLKTFYSTHKFNDWAITVAFYASVHIFEHSLAKSKKVTYRGFVVAGIEHSDQLPSFAGKCGIDKPSGLKIDSKSQHHIRNLLMEGSTEFSSVYAYYNSLYKKSRQSRYNKFSWSDTEVDLVIKHIFVPLLKWFDEHFNTKFYFPS